MSKKSEKIRNLHTLAVEICKRQESEHREVNIAEVKAILKLVCIISAECYFDRDAISIQRMLHERGLDLIKEQNKNK